jgi:hypothetical protein
MLLEKRKKAKEIRGGTTGRREGRVSDTKVMHVIAPRILFSLLCFLKRKLFRTEYKLFEITVTCAILLADVVMFVICIP